MEKEMKLAVLIDAENISSKYIEVILNEANALGNVIYKRIYGNWTSPNMASWRDIILNNAIQPIQQYNNTAGKNSSDSSLIIDAMDLLYSGTLNGFCIVTSDSDFTRLVTRLRESAMYILGMGERKTSRSFISACSKFLYLDLLSGSKPAKKPVKLKLGFDKRVHSSQNADNEQFSTSPEEKNGSDIETIEISLKSLIEENSDEDGWIFSGKLGSLLIKQYPDFDVRNFGYKKFLHFINSLDFLETKYDETDRKIIYIKLK